MRRNHSRFLLLFFICMVHAVVFAAITSNYEQETNLQFAFGPPPVLQTFSSADTDIQSTDFTALLGTLMISTTDNTLFDPALVEMNLDLDMTIEGYVRPNSVSIQYNTQIPVYIRAISVANGKVLTSTIIVGNTLALAANPGNVLRGSDALIVYLVLINEPTIPDYFIPGTIYKLTEDSNVGTFALEATSGGNTPPEEVPISVNGSVPEPEAPFIGTGTGTPPDIPYEGEFTFDHYFEFSILSNPAFFTLDDAITGPRPAVASLQLQVIDALPGNEYGVSIAFSSKDPSGFILHLDNNLANYGIPYHLFWDDEEITNNALLTWRELFTQANTIATAQKQVTVSVSNLESVNTAPEGMYHDTITVIIIPLDTL